MNTFIRSAAQLNAMEVSRPPAIVQKTVEYWEQGFHSLVLKNDKSEDEWLNSYKASGDWRQKYKSWSAACEVGLGITRQWANKRILKYTSELVETGVSESPNTEVKQTLAVVESLPDPIAESVKVSAAQPTPKAEPPPPRTAEEWTRKEQYTVKNPREEPKHRAAPSEPEVVADKHDQPIPKPLLATWERRQEIQDLMTAVSNVKVALVAAHKKSDTLLVRRVMIQDAISNLERLHYQLGHCKPEVLCPECHGTMKARDGKKCGVCQGIGFFCEEEWKKEKKRL